MGETNWTPPSLPWWAPFWEFSCPIQEVSWTGRKTKNAVREGGREREFSSPLLCATFVVKYTASVSLRILHVSRHVNSPIWHLVYFSIAYWKEEMYASGHLVPHFWYRISSSTEFCFHLSDCSEKKLISLYSIWEVLPDSSPLWRFDFYFGSKREPDFELKLFVNFGFWALKNHFSWMAFMYSKHIFWKIAAQSTNQMKFNGLKYGG